LHGDSYGEELANLRVRIAGDAADPESCGKDEGGHKLERQYDVAEMILGEDAAELGGTLINRTWLDLDDTRPSGKLRVLPPPPTSSFWLDLDDTRPSGKL